MRKKYIVVIDSGIGGISVLCDLIKELPNCNYLYFGDNKNAPYGNKSKSQLLNLTVKNVMDLQKYDIGCLVLGCNTLSVTVREELSEIFPFPIFGVYPPIEKEITLNNSTLLLCTCKTAQKYQNLNGVDVLGLKDLALDIENNAFNLQNIDLNKHLKGITILKKHYDTVILGCTHYCFIKNQIIDHFYPQNIISGNKNTVLKVKNFMQKQKSLVNNKRNRVLFVGENAEFNRKFYTSVVNTYYF